MAVQIRSTQMKFDAKVAYDSHPAFTAETDIVDKKYVDDIAAYGVTWKEPVKVLNMVDDSDQGGSPPSGSSGKAYVVNNWGVGFNDGDIIEWQVSAWQVIVSNSGGEPPDGTRILVGGFASGSFSGKDYQFAVYDADTNTWSFTAAEDGDAVLVNGDGGYYENKAFVYDSTSKWIQFAGVGIYTAGNGIQITGDEISAYPNTAQAVQVGLGGIGVKLATGMYGYPGLKFNDHAMETGPLMVLAGDGIEVGVAGVAVKVASNAGLGLSSYDGLFNRAVQPVSVARLFDAVAAGSEPGNPTVGDAYLVSSGSGTWTGSVNVTAGDILVYDDNSAWSKIVSSQGGYVPSGTRVLVASDAIDEFLNHRNRVMVAKVDNDPGNWEYFTPSTGDGVVITTAFGKNLEFKYDGTYWVLSPALQDSGGLEYVEGIVDSGLQVMIKNEGGLGVDGNGLYVDHGDGLTMDGTSLEVDAGKYIKVNANGVNVDETFPFHPPVNIYSLASDADAGGSTPANPVNGNSYVVNNWGGTYVDGDIYQYVGGNWVKIFSTAGSGKPATGIRAVIAPTGASGSFTGWGSRIAWYDGASWSSSTPVDGDVVNVASDAGGLTSVSPVWASGAMIQFNKANSAWEGTLTKMVRQAETNWPAATTTWDLDKTPAQIDKDNVVENAVEIYYNGQRLLFTEGTGGGQGTFYMEDADTVKFDFTPVSGSTMEAVIHYWS